MASGARRARACDALGILIRTLQRWEAVPWRGDRRQGPRSGPQNALSDAERALAVAVVTIDDQKISPLSDLGRAEGRALVCKAAGE